MIKHVIKPGKEVKEGNFQGVVQSYKVDAKEPRLENDAEEFFKITYASSALKRILEGINEMLAEFPTRGPPGRGQNNVRTFLRDKVV